MNGAFTVICRHAQSREKFELLNELDPLRGQSRWCCVFLFQLSYRDNERMEKYGAGQCGAKSPALGQLDKVWVLTLILVSGAALASHLTLLNLFFLFCEMKYNLPELFLEFKIIIYVAFVYVCVCVCFP